jgi:predicted TIM-barrel fold metal-dependent hydrolase
MSGLRPHEVRARIDHPVIDADGHTVEYFPALESYLRAEGVDLAGPDFLRRESGSLGPCADWYGLTPDQRADRRVSRGPWSGAPVETRDLATGVLPGLLYERLDELGIDVSVVYPSYGLLFLHFEVEQARRGACRALNRLNADLFTDYRDRLVPVALIPMHHPDEAVAELEYAVGTLGFSAVVLAGFVQRPVEWVARRDPELAPWALWTDTFGLDSPYDYDPVWEACRRLGVSPSFHSGALGWQNRRSVSSYVYNHVGMLGESNHAVAKSLLMGGVTRRFSDLNFAFLEGGVAWAASLLADLVGHWEKRNGATMAQLDPGRIDADEMARLFAAYGGKLISDPAPLLRAGYRDEDVDLMDEFAACGIERAEDIVELFAPRFFFGCEADDPMASTAFNTRANPGRARLHALFGSDISHWDVPVMDEVLGESYELVEHGLLSSEDYRDFMFANAVRFYTRANPAFFEQTPVAAVAAELAAPAS